MPSAVISVQKVLGMSAPPKGVGRLRVNHANPDVVRPNSSRSSSLLRLCHRYNIAHI
jgi:hypothetical protein